MSINQQQIEYWNGEGGERWVAQDQSIDTMIRPIGLATLDAAGVQAGERVIDIGCGCGNQTLELARRAGTSGSVLGIDVSGPMLAVARAHAAEDDSPRAALEFLQADAAGHPFAAQSADLLFSRFGVMFFADPAAAFANLRSALRPGGRLVFCCWRAMKENELMLLPLRAALEHLPPPDPVPPDAPGPFAFADRERVLGILRDAGFRDPTLEALDCELHFGVGLQPLDIARRLLDVGPASRLLAQAPPGIPERIERSLCEAIAARCGAAGFPVYARCWLARAAS